MSDQGQWQVAGDAADTYERALIPAVFAAWAPLVVALADPRPGERVLDVACGTGVVTRLAAKQVGHTGNVVGLDLNPGMLAVAASRAANEPPTSAPMTWQEASVTQSLGGGCPMKGWALRIGLGFMLLAAPLAAETQPAGKPVRIGWISVTSPDRGPEQQRPIVEHHLRQSGWNPHFELRYADGDLTRLAAMAEELGRAQIDVIVAPDTQGARAAQKATATIPIVMSSGDPIGAGLVTSLAKPGGNITGVSAAFDDSFAGKWVELLRDIGPVTSIAVVWNPASARAAGRIEVIERAAANHGLRVLRLEIRNTADVDAVVQALARPSAGGLIFDADLTLIPYRDRIVEATRRHRVPSVFAYAQQVAAGGLLGYGPSLTDVYRLIGVYVDRILRGSKPSELPVEQVRKYDLVINLRTAKALGLTIPPSLLQRADQVIE